MSLEACPKFTQDLILARLKAGGIGPLFHSHSPSSLLWKEVGTPKAEEIGIADAICHKSCKL